MCECKRTIQGKLLERFKENAPEATGHDVTLLGYALILEKNALKERGCMTVETVAKFPLKKGGTKEKKDKVSMTFTYCPFCAEKYV